MMLNKLFNSLGFLIHCDITKQHNDHAAILFKTLPKHTTLLELFYIIGSLNF